MAGSRANNEEDPPVDRDSEGVYYISVADFERRREPDAPASPPGPEARRSGSTRSRKAPAASRPDEPDSQ